jgi:hypothetical protein
VTLYVPNAVGVAVSTAVAVPPFGNVTVVGVRDVLSPGVLLVMLRDTVPVKFEIEFSETVDVVLAPRPTVTLFGLEILKSGDMLKNSDMDGALVSPDANAGRFQLASIVFVNE